MITHILPVKPSKDALTGLEITKQEIVAFNQAKINYVSLLYKAVQYSTKFERAKEITRPMSNLLFKFKQDTVIYLFDDLSVIDIFVNDNFIYWDDLVKICKEVGLTPAKPIYEGVYRDFNQTVIIKPKFYLNNARPFTFKLSNETPSYVLNKLERIVNNIPMLTLTSTYFKHKESKMSSTVSKVLNELTKANLFRLKKLEKTYKISLNILEKEFKRLLSTRLFNEVIVPFKENK